MKATSIAIIVSALLIGAAILFAPDQGKEPTLRETPTQEGENVSIEDGTQVIQIDAKGGYYPRKSVARAGIPTVIRFNTQGTFDCSAAVRIPSKGVDTILPNTGATDIAVGTPSAGPLQGSCGMGMYPFSVEFVE